MISDEKNAPRNLVITTVIVEGGIGLVAIGLGAWLGQPPLELLHWQPELISWALLATLPLIAGMLIVTHAPLPPLRRLRDFVIRYIVPLFPQLSLWQIALISMMAGVGEELFFRGWMQRGLSQTIDHDAAPWIALAISSLAFGLAHHVTTMYAVLTGLVSAYLGFLLIHFDNLLVPIVVHAAYDFVAMVYLSRRFGTLEVSLPEPIDPGTNDST